MNPYLVSAIDRGPWARRKRPFKSGPGDYPQKQKYTIEVRIFSIPFFLLGLLFSFHVHADVEGKLIRKVAVFPIADANYATSEDAWWQMRDLLTKDKTLLIAAKRFMINRGVFQPRRSLKPADAIILGRLLDAEALVVTYVEDRTLKMKVYEGENGYVLWTSEYQFHPAVPINDQLIKLTSKMASDFVDSIPYQGFTERDEVEDKVLFEKEGKTFVKVFFGGRSQLLKGDPVQWVTVKGDPSQPLFPAAKVQIVAEGVVSEISGDDVLVQVQSAKRMEDIDENSLVRFPKEISNLRDLYVNQDSKQASSENLNGHYFKDQLKPVNEFQKDNTPASTGVAFFLNIAVFALLAF